MSKPTLAKHFDKLTHVERVVLMFALNSSGVLKQQVHLGMLPFVTGHDAISALQYCNPEGHSKRLMTEMLVKLKQWYGDPGKTQFTMYLDGGKVAKRFGIHPEYGVKIPVVMPKRVYAGNLPRPDYFMKSDGEPLHITAHKYISLKPGKRKGVWQVICERAYEAYIRKYLHDVCY